MNTDYILGNSNNIAPSAVYIKKASGEYAKVWQEGDDLRTPPIDVDYETVDEQGTMTRTSSKIYRCISYRGYTVLDSGR